MARKAKIGDRVVWESLDSTVKEYGRITALSPSATKAEIEWDDGLVIAYDLYRPGTSVRVLDPEEVK